MPDLWANTMGALNRLVRIGAAHGLPTQLSTASVETAGFVGGHGLWCAQLPDLYLRRLYFWQTNRVGHAQGGNRFGFWPSRRKHPIVPKSIHSVTRPIQSDLAG
ncbi:protein of unknown function [Azospirillum lipoferum 4B]|uniref:Uncharacterized protein n=1 Tax=Azospirillum lipoferum (strain 4B) TaxID=862719 RepID=G7Z4H4_AZOL4|nr:protein of unknown function [Azospirillum lipoferum 4B]